MVHSRKGESIFEEFYPLLKIILMVLSLTVFPVLSPLSGLCICWISSRKVSLLLVIQHFYLSLVFCRYFENYKNVGEFLDLDLLDHLGDTILMNERLMFLGELKKNLSDWLGGRGVVDHGCFCIHRKLKCHQLCNLFIL